MKTKNVIIAVAALVVGVAIGWFAAGVANSSGDDPGRACCPRCADAGGVGRVAIPDVGSSAAKPKRSAPTPSAESERKASAELSGEKPKENAGEQAAGNDTKPDNPFPRYLDMFKNNPEALAAEFEKEAEANRTELREMRDEIIRDWKLNEEEASLLEKALDDLCEEVRRMNEEFVGIIASGQLDDESAEDGSFMCGNHLLSQKKGEAVRTAFRETAEKLYEQLVPDGVSAADEQLILWNAARHTAFSYDSFEPFLQVYDKVYKNMGFGNGIFSWNARQRQLKKK